MCRAAFDPFIFPYISSRIGSFKTILASMIVFNTLSFLFSIELVEETLYQGHAVNDLTVLANHLQVEKDCL